MPAIHCNVTIFIFPTSYALSPISYSFRSHCHLQIPVTNELSEDISPEGVL